MLALALSFVAVFTLILVVAIAPPLTITRSSTLMLPSFGGSGSGDALGALRSLQDLLKNLIILLGALTNYAEDAIVKHLYRTGSYTKPTVMAHALFTATPGETGGGTEVSGGSYARVDAPPLDANWAATSGGNGTTSNVSAITFPAPTANWGTVTSTAQLDATSSGNMLTYGPLTTSKTINNGDASPAFAASAFSLAFD